MADSPDASNTGDEIAFELGDRILLLGGRYDNLRGRIYYIDDSLIRVLPDGVSDRLVDLPIVDGDLDPDLGIQHLYSLSKRANPAFVVQIDARVGLVAETFTETGEVGPVFTIQAVSEATDSLVLVDETGAETAVSFEFRGIPRDLPFAVLRPRLPAVAAAETLGAEDEAASAPANQEETPESELVDEFQDVVDAEMAGELAEEDISEIREIPAAQRFYPDLVQRNDMIQDFVAALSFAAQKNAGNQKAIRSLVEQCLQLRNTVVAYNRSGEPQGDRPVSADTLSDLIARVSIPLSRPVLSANRVLFLDHTAADIASRAKGNPSQDPTEVADVDVTIKYLEDVVLAQTELQKKLLSSQAPLSAAPDALPNWYIAMDTIQKQLEATWTAKTELDTIVFRNDKEFLRAPAIDMETALVDGLPARMPGPDFPVTSELVGKVRLGLQRALGPRTGRVRDKEGPRRIESPEEGPVAATLLFPLSEQRDLGATLSGSLARDIALSHGRPQSLGEILERLDGIPEVPVAGGIVSVGEDGNTMGNIPVEDWLRSQPVILMGLGDAILELANYGLQQTELTVAQQEALIEKVDAYRALVKQYITETRDVAAKAMTQLVRMENPMLTGEAYADIMEVLGGEPLLAARIEELKLRLPQYKTNDIALFAGLMATSADLVLTALAGAAGPLARERNRQVRDQFLDVLAVAVAKLRKRLMAGEPPERNECPHVPSYIAIKKVRDDADRLQLFARFLAKFQSGRDENWITCNSCPKHLACYHEVLMLQEFLHPREKDTIHKELLLRFSGGQFHGRHICKNCGQPISELEFDNNLEFSDDGAPLSGRAVLEQAAEEAEEEIRELVGPAIAHEEVVFKTETQQLIYKAARRLFDLVGISPVAEAYQRIVERVESEILKQPSREEYARITKGKRVIDYDVLINRILVASTAVNVLIEIQTGVPGYVMRYRLPGCRAGFSGFPLGNEKDRTGVEYIVCAVAAIREPEAPWNLTGFQRETADKKRQESIAVWVEKYLTSALTFATVQQQLSAKRTYLEQLYGSAQLAEELPELVPNGFRPLQFRPDPEEAAKTEVVAAGAKPAEVIRGWIQEAHRIGAMNGPATKGNPLSEATCCSVPIQEPGAFWRKAATSMVALPAKQPPRGPVRSHLGLAFQGQPLAQLEAEVSPDTIYRIFLRVCYTGPRMGLPHEPGYTNLCPHCGFVFPESPYIPKPIPPMSSDRATQKELMATYKEEVEGLITKGKVALETQRIKTDAASFEALLDASHRAFLIPVPERTTPMAGMRLFELLRTLDPEPFEGWRELLAVTMERISKIPPGAEELEFADAYGPMSVRAEEILAELSGRLGAEHTAALRRVLESAPVALVEAIRTYVLVPFQRLCNGFNTKDLTVPAGYKFAEGATKDLDGLIATHLEFMGILSRRVIGLTRRKLEWARTRLAVALDLLQRRIRSAYFPGAAVGLPFVTTVLVGGILAEFVDPNVVPPGAEEGAAGVDTGARAPIQILDVCMQKLRQEGLNFTPEQITEAIQRRDEIEKGAIIGRMDRMNPEERRMELMKKRLGLGDWAVGGTKAIYAYDPEQYERERLQRMEMGFTDFIPAEPITMGGEDGYDVAQMREDDA